MQLLWEREMDGSQCEDERVLGDQLGQGNRWDPEEEQGFVQ